MNTQYIAEVVFRTNGKEVQSNIAAYRRELKAAQAEKKQLEQSHANGETWTQKEIKAMSRCTKTIEKCRKKLDESQASSKRLKQTLDTLDTTNPVKLQRTLKSLEASLKKVERGSEAWGELTEAISKTKAELQKIKQEQAAFEETGMKPPKSLIQQFRDGAGKWLGASSPSKRGEGVRRA